MIAAKIYLQVQEVARDMVEESEVGPEQKSFEKCKEQLFKLSPSSNSEYHISQSKASWKSKTIFTAYFFLLLLPYNLYNFAKLQTKFERISSFFKSTVSNTSKWHLCVQMQSWLEFQLKSSQHLGT